MDYPDEPTPHPEPPTSDHTNKTKRRRLIWATFWGIVAAFIVVAGIIIVVHFGARHRNLHIPQAVPTGQNTPESGENTPPASADNSSANSSAEIIFDDRGSRSSTYIRVYPGIRRTTYDETSNGVYDNGDTIRAICESSGREVRTDPTQGEQPLSTSAWVQIAPTNYSVEFATLAYARLVGQVPHCAKTP